AFALGSSATRTSRTFLTAASALTGSCHQWGSNRDASGPELSPGSLTGTAAERSTTFGWPPASETTFPIQWSRLAPFSRTTCAPAVGSTSAGRGWYSWGSVLGCRIWWTVTAGPPTTRAQSAICVVVATTSTVPGRPPLATPHPVSTSTAPKAAATPPSDRGV